MAIKGGRHPIQRAMAKWSRWLHIYLSMVSLAAILFFSLTGLTLNHPDWFFREYSQTIEGQLNPQWLNGNGPEPADWDQTDYGHQVDKLAVVEYLRSQHRLHGRVGEFLSFADECEVTFQGPGYAATARIHRSDGAYQLSQTTNDLVSVLNDLHKGRHTGKIWSWVIDVSALISAAVALSGFVLVFFLRLNRAMRLVVALGGLLVVWLVAWLAV